MPYPWFKFFGGDYLHDEKMLGMDSHVRSCWLTLLCYASTSESQNGSVRYLTEEQLMLQAGVPLGGEEWDRTKGILERFVSRGMIEVEKDTIRVINWDKRQSSYLSPAERQKKSRDGRHKIVTLEEDKEEDKEKKPTASIKYLSDLPEETLKLLTETYEASTGQVKKKALDLVNYCAAKGKTYKNYHAFLENALSKDFGRRVKLQPKVVEIEAPLDANALARVEALKKEIGKVARGMTV